MKSLMKANLPNINKQIQGNFVGKNPTEKTFWFCCVFLWTTAGYYQCTNIKKLKLFFKTR